MNIKQLHWLTFGFKNRNLLKNRLKLMYFLLMWDMPKQLFLQSVSEALQQPCDLFRAMDSLACAILILPFYRIYIKNTANLKFYKIKNCKLNFLKPLKKHGKILVLIKNLIFILKNLQMARI